MLSSEHVVSQTVLNRYPKPLLLSNSQYPDFKEFHWQEIQQLWPILFHFFKKILWLSYGTRSLIANL
ncbi:DUF3404 domain-containing protein [Photobacterium alginatilyticum]|uniref:DUF3404 domain-containing protein n=1 Tax=Photobacterium alginatilyticum TaxID=1775171 RepID=A0ABW9YPA6_9GAMM|nr:DUF3404 domain-containing protein [Photobacterium alginatilyticum]